MPLLFNETAELWFNSLTIEIQTKWNKLKKAFRKHFIDDCHHRQERILNLLHFKQDKQTFEQYFEFMISEMTSLGFRDDIQLAFIVSNLEPRLKCLILQHQPYNSTAELHGTATYCQENKNEETDHANACDNSKLQRFDSCDSVSEFVETINSSNSCNDSDNADNCPGINTEKPTMSKHVRYSAKDASKCEREVKPYLCVNRYVKSTVAQTKTSNSLHGMWKRQKLAFLGRNLKPRNQIAITEEMLRYTIILLSPVNCCACVLLLKHKLLSKNKCGNRSYIFLGYNLRATPQPVRVLN